MNVVVTDPTMIQRMDELKALVEPEIKWQVCNRDEEQLLEALSNAEVFVGSPFTAEMAHVASKLRLIQLAGAGTGGIDFSNLPVGVMVANTYNHERSIAEYVLMCMLALMRRLLTADRELRSGNWYAVRHDPKIPLPESLEGQTVGIIGLGHIGQQVARLSGALGMRVVAIKNNPDSELEQALGLDFLGTQADLPRLLNESDFLVVALPLTAKTMGLIDAAAFNSMRSSAFLINVSRGDIVDERALYEALFTNQIAGAAIDTWYQYPDNDGKARPSTYPFHELDNIIMTPHTSGETTQTNGGRARDIAENINRLCSGRPLINLVTS